jgi:hypothetical protein
LSRYRLFSTSSLAWFWPALHGRRLRFGVKGKLAPRYIGPYEVIEACGLVAYRIQLPERFSAVHNVFHVTQLKKGMLVLENEVITEANAWIEPDFSLIEHPLRVLDQKERK